MTKEEIMQAIEGMTVLELSELVKAMEEKFGVSAAAPVAACRAAKYLLCCAGSRVAACCVVAVAARYRFGWDALSVPPKSVFRAGQGFWLPFPCPAPLV